MAQLNKLVNLVVCQKSKIEEWCEHFEQNYDCIVYNLTDKSEKNRLDLMDGLYRAKYHAFVVPAIFVITYDMLLERSELLKLKDFTLIFDDPPLIQKSKERREDDETE